MAKSAAQLREAALPLLRSGAAVRRWAKALVILAGCALLFVPAIFFAPTTVLQPGGVPIDYSWVSGLAATFQQGQIAGRDFQFNYGPLVQVVAWGGMQFLAGGSAPDAVPAIFLAFFALNIALLGLVLALIPQVDHRQSFVILVALGLLKIPFDLVTCRALLPLLCGVILARALGAATRRARLLLAALTAAPQLGKPPNWVRDWRRTWVREGFRLIDKPGRGRKPALSPPGRGDGQSARLRTAGAA